MFGVRVLGDRFLASETVWTTFVDTNHTIVKLLILMVCVGIGLQIRIREIIDVGWRSVLAGGAASFAMAGLSLAILYTFAVGSIALSALVGVGGLAASFVVHRAFP